MQAPVFLFVSNSKYFHLTLLAIRSLLKNCHPRRVLVFDVGLSAYQRLVIKRESKLVRVLKSGRTHSTTTNQDQGWVRAVGEKTEILRELTHSNKYFPLVLADSDLVFLEDPSTVINPNFSIQVTRRASQQIRQDGRELDYIASFLVVNDLGALDFIDSWRTRMATLQGEVEAPFESLAQHLVTKEYLSSGVVGELREDEVACDRGYVEGVTRAVHLKSMGPSNHREVLLSRLKKVEHLPLNLRSLAQKYLGWRFELLRIREFLRRVRLKGLRWAFRAVLSSSTR